MKPWLRVLGTALAVVSSLAFVAYVVSTLDFGDLAHHLTWRSIPALVGSVLLYSLIVPLAALAWQVLLTELGHEARWSTLNTILLATQAGKYLPGNVAQHLGRVALSLSFKIPGPVLIASMAYEFLLLIVADLLTAIVASALSAPGIALIGIRQGAAMAIVVAGSISALAAISIFGKLLPRLVRWLMPESRRGEEALAPLRPRVIVRVIVIYVAAMVCVGASISVLAWELSATGTADFALLTAAFTIAWAVGFVTPGAPAGIGVREALLLLLLGPTLGAQLASLVIIALRVATTLGDMLCFAVGTLLLARVHHISRAGRGALS